MFDWVLFSKAGSVIGSIVFTILLLPIIGYFFDDEGWTWVVWLLIICLFGSLVAGFHEPINSFLMR